MISVPRAVRGLADTGPIAMISVPPAVRGTGVAGGALGGGSIAGAGSERRSGAASERRPGAESVVTSGAALRGGCGLRGAGCDGRRAASSARGAGCDDRRLAAMTGTGATAAGLDRTSDSSVVASGSSAVGSGLEAFAAALGLVALEGGRRFPFAF